MANVPFHSILEKARELKKKYQLSESEFEEFRRQFEMALAGKNDATTGAHVPHTALSKILGHITIDAAGTGFKLSDVDYKLLQDILKLYEESKAEHSRCVLQSMTYEDCASEALGGEYKPELGHNASCHIHPVLAALFIPKFELIDKHFLQASIPYIVKARYNKEPLKHRPDYELFYSLVTDPNDVVCDAKSTLKDLYNRCNLQRHLWKAVNSLRNGQYYDCSTTEFIIAIDQCRVNKFESPELLYGKYDGTVMKRLLSAFSFRPTVVATTPNIPTNVLGFTNPFMQRIVPTVASTSTIDLRLPLQLEQGHGVDLKRAMSLTQPYFENGMITLRNQSVLYSRGVLIFFIERRSHYIRAVNMEPHRFSVLPAAVSGFERLNDTEVNFEDQISLRDDVYRLRSVVCAETNKATPVANLIIGSSAAIYVPPCAEINRFTPEYLLYDPYNANWKRKRTGGPPVRQTPVTHLSEGPALSNEVEDFRTMAMKRGICFVYENIQDKSQGAFWV